MLAVRTMFFGAERRRAWAREEFPLRRSEPAVIAFVLMFGLSGYLAHRYQWMGTLPATIMATSAAGGFAVVVTWLAVATARVRPAHDPDDPRFVLQGRVGIVTASIDAGLDGVIEYRDLGGIRTAPARDVDGGAIDAGEEVCIERVEDGVAFVERWTHVEQRL